MLWQIESKINKAPRFSMFTRECAGCTAGLSDWSNVILIPLRTFQRMLSSKHWQILIIRNCLAAKARLICYNNNGTEPRTSRFIRWSCIFCGQHQQEIGFLKYIFLLKKNKTKISGEAGSRWISNQPISDVDYKAKISANSYISPWLIPWPGNIWCEKLWHEQLWPFEARKTWFSCYLSY